jgi:glycosyltransferase involved in cell wall biosynthesis
MNDKRKISILFLASWFPSASAPVLGIFVQRQAKAIALFCSVTVLKIASKVNNANGVYALSEYVEDGYAVIEVLYKKLNSPFRIFNVFRYLNAYRIAFARYKKQKTHTDIVHLNVVFPAAIPALLIKNKLNVPLVLSEHWSGYLEGDGNYKGFFLKTITRLLMKSASAVIVVSETLKHAMKEQGLRGSYFTVPNVVSDQFISQKGLRDKGSGFPHKIVHISSMVNREKNTRGLLRAVQKLSQSRQDFILYIFGDGPERKVHELYAGQLGIKERVVFGGYRKPYELAEFMRGASFYVQFSNFETYGCVIVEAFSCGLPAISTPTGIAKSIVTEANGIVVSIGDEEMLKNAMGQMLDENEKYRKNITFNALEYTEAEVGKQIGNIYKLVLKNKHV